jgi:diguanylate cyclase (GGDEF)-like protein
MSLFESATTRILPAMAELIGRPLYVSDGGAIDAGNVFAVRNSVPRISIVAPEDRPFARAERRLLQEMFDIIRMAEESEARYQELEQRMLSMQRENLDLVVRNRMLNEVSSRDTLTGLYNRWFVLEKLDGEINRSLRHGSPMSLLMLDIDHFKDINDTWGHAAGDEVLKVIGRLLRESCRVYDVPGRYGGEEFCVLLPETLPGNTTIVAERIRRRLETTPLPLGDREITVTASIGIAGMEHAEGSEILSPAALIERADKALYSAKHRGRNRIELWDGALMKGAAEATGH